ncbi:prepilin-type N-terminal cleavage/methylation domain-containing protein [Bacillus testis]|uniref:prepilin-type N-terminal cleavage/methylation domain-containing protein n=1 Tax=Bacillus testis TaxID=1622072 RepID=UPI0008410983|nr:prepilin-type N-terminal cleavage/methylation domain-containing protein [Bacillus testis]
MKKLMKKLRDTLNNERGLTLIELLAVVVILAIIAAIAIPSIGGLLDNTKKDAHIANAEQMISSARLAVTADKTLTTDQYYLSLQYLYDENYIEKIKDPDGGEYEAGVNDTTKPIPSAAPSGSYVEVTDGKITAVKLINNGEGKKDRGIQTSGGAAFALFSENSTTHKIESNELTRKSIADNTKPPKPEGK